MSKIPATIDVNPSGNSIDACVIWLHGLGAHGGDFSGLSDQLGLPSNHRVRFVFPNAPFRNITVNQGMRMRAWYDIESLAFVQKEDDAGIKDSESLIHLLIDREVALGIPTERIILAGFSQGSAMSLYTGLRYPKSLGAIVALSGYLPLAQRLAEERAAANHNLPILMAHGLFDPVVPLALGEKSRTFLESLGYSIEWHTYSMEHTICPKEIVDIGRFLTSVL